MIGSGCAAMWKITQIGSPIGRRSDQRATLIALGLNKINRTRVVGDDSSTRGRIDKVKHLLRVERASGPEN